MGMKQAACLEAEVHAGGSLGGASTLSFTPAVAAASCRPLPKGLELLPLLPPPLSCL